MSYYQENRPAMGGLADALAMQGRRGDSTLVHMNPMEVRMLETMSPDGSLSINPETGLPEAFKLKDIASFALPIAAGIAAPYLLPAIGVTGLSGVAAGAIGAGVGGFGSGLIQGKGVKDSLIQGGLSGLMSYGLGSAFAPATQTGPQALSGVPTATPTDPAVVNAALGVGQPASISSIAPPIAPGTPTSSFANLGLGPKGAVPYTAAADVYAPGTSETGLGQMLDTAGRTSPFGSTAFDGSQLGPTQLPTYTQIGGTALGSAGQMALDGMLSPEEMPYDIAGMDDMDAYYAGRIPDLEAGRRRGRAAARQLQSPPSFLTSGGMYERAISPGGGGTFFAADGGRVPNAYGNPYGDPYGPGDPYGGVADEQETSGTGPGMSLGSFSEPVADIGLGAFNPTPMSIGLTALGMVPGPIGMIANVANIGRGLANVMGPANVNAIGQSQVSGVGNQSVDAYGNPVGSMENIASEMNMGNKGFDAADDVEGMMSDAVQGFADAHEGEVGDAGAAAAANADAAAEAAATADAMGLAQGGGISSLAYGGDAAPVGFANKAFEGMVPGDGTGMSDDIPFSIEGNQPALLSRDEYVLPADVVSQLGDGSSGAGADMLDNFISQVRQTKYGNTQQPAPVGPQLMTGLMRQGGVV